MAVNRRIKRFIVSAALVVAVTATLAVVSVMQLRLEKSAYRHDADYVPEPELKERVARDCRGCDDPRRIISYCCGLSAELLSFDRVNDLLAGKANCIGYARHTSAIINHAFRVNGLPWRARRVVGKVYWCGIDINHVAQMILPPRHRAFFRDHDFVEVNLGEETVYVDSSLKDLLGVDVRKK